MKEVYETPEMEVVEFETEDIITASGNDLPEVTFPQYSMSGKKLFGHRISGA